MTKRIDIDIPSTDKGNDTWDYRKYPEMIPSEPSMLDELDQWVLTSEQIAKAKAGFWLIPDILYHNHACIICAPANAGKTRITFYLMCQLADDGVDVRYINMDINLYDATVMKREADAVGMKFITPDLNGIYPEEVYKYLEKVARSGEDLNNVIFVIDNLKQIADVISKREIKEKMQTLCNTLTSTGATIVILAHTNKYTDNNGKLIFEGTSDIKHLTSELFYLVSDETANGQTVQFISDKNRVRGKPKPISFEIDLEGNVTESLSPVDVVKRKEDRVQRAKDNDGITAAKARLRVSECKQGELADYVRKETGIGKRAAIELVKRYTGKPTYWTEETSDNNAKVYKKW